MEPTAQGRHSPAINLWSCRESKSWVRPVGAEGGVPTLGPHSGHDLGGELVEVGAVDVGPQHGHSPVEGTAEKVQAKSDVGVGGQFAAVDGALDKLSGLGAAGISYRFEERGGEFGVAGPFGEQIGNDLAGEPVCQRLPAAVQVFANVVVQCAGVGDLDGLDSNL